MFWKDLGFFSFQEKKVFFLEEIAFSFPLFDQEQHFLKMPCLGFQSHVNINMLLASWNQLFSTYY